MGFIGYVAAKSRKEESELKDGRFFVIVSKETITKGHPKEKR